RVAPGEIECRLRRIDTGRRGGARLQGRNAPRTHIAAYVQNPCARREVAREPCPIVRLIVEPARLLSVRERRGEAQARLEGGDVDRYLAECGLRKLRQLLELPCGGIVL